MKNSIGPSRAKTTRRQALRIIPRRGIVLENVTIVEGIPAADCFRVQDQWIVELPNNEIAVATTPDEGTKSLPKPCLQFSVSFQIHFLKRTMLKPLIQKTIRQEAKQWYQSYVKMIQDSLHLYHSDSVQLREEGKNYHPNNIRRSFPDEPRTKQTMEGARFMNEESPTTYATNASSEASHLRVLHERQGILSAIRDMPDGIYKILMVILLCLLVWNVAQMNRTLDRMETQIRNLQLQPPLPSSMEDITQTCKSMA